MRKFPILWIASVLVLMTLLGGCLTAPIKTATMGQGETVIMRQVMARKDKIVHLSSEKVDRNKPVLLLLHGATDDPSEMMKISAEWKGRYNVFLYSYNYHQPVEKIASDLAREMKRLKMEDESILPKHGRVENITVIAYSYSAIVFRMAVILTDDRTQFSNVSLIQLVPTAGGSYRARYMGIPGAAWCVYPASKPSFAMNPYGSVAKELWEGEGNRKFYAAINPGRMFTILVEADSHSLAGVHNQGVHRRYLNGIGLNVETIPKSAGVTHDYFPGNAVGLEYLRKILERSPAEANTADWQYASPVAPQTSRF